MTCRHCGNMRSAVTYDDGVEVLYSDIWPRNGEKVTIAYCRKCKEITRKVIVCPEEKRSGEND